MKDRNTVEVEYQEVHAATSDSATYWLNEKNNKVFKMNGAKTPKGKVRQISEAEYEALFSVNTNSDIFIKKEAATGISAYLNKKSVPFDLSSFPSEDEIKHLSVDSDNLMKDLTESLLDKQRANMDSTMIESLNALIFEAKKLDPASVNRKGMAGMFMKMMKVKEKFFTRYDTVKAKITALSEVLDSEKDKQIKLIQNIDDLEKVNENYARQTNEELKTVMTILEYMKNEIDKWPEPETQEQANIMNKARRRIQLLEKREMDLNGFLAISAQMMPEISNLRDNSEVLVNNFNEMTAKVIPAYILNFSKFVIGHQQAKALNLSNKTKSSFNDALVNGSEQTKVNTIAIEKLKHAPLIEISTLRAVHTNLVQTSLGVQQVIKEAKTKRENYLDTVDNIGKSLIEMSKQNIK